MARPKQKFLFEKMFLDGEHVFGPRLNFLILAGSAATSYGLGYFISISDVDHFDFIRVGIIDLRATEYESLSPTSLPYYLAMLVCAFVFITLSLIIAGVKVCRTVKREANVKNEKVDSTILHIFAALVLAFAIAGLPLHTPRGDLPRSAFVLFYPFLPIMTAGLVGFLNFALLQSFALGFLGIKGK